MITFETPLHSQPGGQGMEVTAMKMRERNRSFRTDGFDAPLLSTPCAHRRMIDEIRTRRGTPTGKVRCLECGVIFDDPPRP